MLNNYYKFVRQVMFLIDLVTLFFYQAYRFYLHDSF